MRYAGVLEMEAGGGREDGWVMWLGLTERWGGHG